MTYRWLRVKLVGVAALLALFFAPPAVASPFGDGVFGADIPFGAVTSIAINLGGDVAVPMTLAGSFFSGSNSHTVTVTSTDVVGYYLYVHANGSSNMVNGAATIPASANSSPAPLAANTWGFNATGSTSDFAGMGLTSTQIKDAAGPYKNGDATSVTYGAYTDAAQTAGDYTVDVTYTVVAKNQ